jgi:hypothetical protein
VVFIVSWILVFIFELVALFAVASSIIIARSLDECFVARANAKQRRGRAGRVAPGLAVHLVTRHRFDVRTLFALSGCIGEYFHVMNIIFMCLISKKWYVHY